MTDKLRQLFVCSRPISWINTAYPFAAVLLVFNYPVNAELLLGTLYFLIPYNILMYGVNDVFDYESDMRNPRKGGVEGAVLKKQYHRVILLAALITNVPFVMYFLTIGSTRTKLFFIYLVAMQLAYTLPKFRFKEKAFLDSFTSSTHFVSPMVYGFLLVGWRPAYWPYVIAFFLWGMASHAYGSVQDIIPDKEAGISSIATIIGGARTVRLAVIAYGASFIVLATQNSFAALAGACNVLYMASIVPFVCITDKKSETARAGWKRFLKLNWFTGFVITILLINKKLYF